MEDEDKKEFFCWRKETVKDKSKLKQYFENY